MPNNKFKKLVWMLPCLVMGVSSALFTSCDDDDINGSIIEMPASDMWDTTAIGKYIYQNYTLPYNIRVIYRWEDARQEMGNNLVPAKEEKIVPFLTMLKRVWLDTYVEMLGAEDFATYTVKELLLTGSRAVNTDGSETLGFAEGGRQILLYDVNNLSPADMDGFVDFFHTIHHEFAHILQQNNKDYDGEYRVLSQGLYTSSWVNTSNDAAREMGFITGYSRAEVNEDFVEMLSVKLVNCHEGWEYLIEQRTQSEASRKILREKERIVDEWMKNVWDVDVNEFQNLVYSTIKREVGLPEAEDYIYDGNRIIGKLENGNLILY